MYLMYYHCCSLTNATVPVIALLCVETSSDLCKKFVAGEQWSSDHEVGAQGQLIPDINIP